MDLPVTGALVVVAAFVSAMVSGAAGFGGAILLLPALTTLLSLEKALPLLALAQFTGNIARAAFGWRRLNLPAIAWFSLGAVPAGLVAITFVTTVPPGLLRQMIGLLILFVAILEIGNAFGRLPVAIERFRPPGQPGFWLTAAGCLVGAASGLAGTTGPLPNAFFLRLQLAPAAYVATDAAAMGILHGAKLAAFGAGQWLQGLDPVLSVWVCSAMVIGTWCGKQLLKHLTLAAYQKAVAVWMLVSATAFFFSAAE